MKTITRFALSALIAGLVISVISFTTQNNAAALFSGATDQACSGANLQTADTTCSNTAGSVSSLVNTVIDIISWIVGIVSIIMVVFGGFRYVTSGGDSTATSNARNTILYALVGLVIAVLAQVLVHFVLGRAAHAVNNPNAFLQGINLFKIS
jgi:uncharacterized membrane protein